MGAGGKEEEQPLKFSGNEKERESSRDRDHFLSLVSGKDYLSMNIHSNRDGEERYYSTYATSTGLLSI